MASIIVCPTFEKLHTSHLVHQVLISNVFAPYWSHQALKISALLTSRLRHFKIILAGSCSHAPDHVCQGIFVLLCSLSSRNLASAWQLTILCPGLAVWPSLSLGISVVGAQPSCLCSLSSALPSSQPRLSLCHPSSQLSSLPPMVGLSSLLSQLSAQSQG